MSAGGQQQIEQIRRLQKRPDRDLTIGEMIRATAESATTCQRKLGALIDVWQATVPDEYARGTSIASLRGGTATVFVDSASVLYELDRFLRSGGLQELRRGYRGTLARVRLKRRTTG